MSGAVWRIAAPLNVVMIIELALLRYSHTETLYSIECQYPLQWSAPFRLNVTITCLF